jgi:nicotinate-nucleotide adenylyltransferase
MRLGIFGGSFDPVHYGHLLLAEHCRETCRLDRVLFVPAATPPHKLEGLCASSQQRVEMLKLAIAGYECFEVSTVELDRGGVSYTVDTLSDLRNEMPDAELFFLMGAESLADLPTWREPGTICKLATIVVVRRAGAPAVDFGILSEFASSSRLEDFRAAQFETPIIELSSTDIRQRVANGASIRFRTSRAVEKYIESNRLYQSTEGGIPQE